VQQLLAGLVAPLTRALRDSQARCFHTPSPVMRAAGPVVLLFTPELKVLGRTGSTQPSVVTGLGVVSGAQSASRPRSGEGVVAGSWRGCGIRVRRA